MTNYRFFVNSCRKGKSRNKPFDVVLKRKSLSFDRSELMVFEVRILLFSKIAKFSGVSENIKFLPWTGSTIILKVAIFSSQRLFKNCCRSIVIFTVE